MESNRWASSLVNSRGMCWTITTAAPRSSGSRGIISASARGPPVEEAIATTFVSASGDFVGAGTECAVTDGVGARIPFMLTVRAASSADISCSRTDDRSMLTGPDGFRTNSSAPRSSARRVISFPSSEPAALSITTGRGISAMICSSACKPFSRGISMSRVTMSGLRTRIRCRASTPSPAVPTTWNIPLDSTSSAMSFRMKALSSTTSTVVRFSFAAVMIKLDLAEDPLARVDRREKISRLAEKGFDFSQHQKSARRQRPMHFEEQRVLRFALEVDDDVAAEQEVNVFYRKPVAEQVARLESHQATHLGNHRVQSGDLREVSIAQSGRRFSEG